jgi:hypothetical protein
MARFSKGAITLVMRSLFFGSLLLSLMLPAAIAACGTSSPGQFAEPDASTPVFATDGGGGPCEGLACAVANCKGGAPTTVEGDVYDPARKNKLYNVIVYVPNAALDAIPEGPSCERCGALPSGKPIAIALTDEKGHFKLENVPTGDKIPLVIQVGKWRRELVIPSVAACQTTTLPDKTITLPKNSKEGHIPKMAVVAGGFDDLPCVLRNIGIEDSEFSSPEGTARIHIYTGASGGKPDTGAVMPASALWGAPAKAPNPAFTPKLDLYDQVVLTCEGSEYTSENPGGQSVLKSQDARRAMRDYLNKGGRVFAEHYHYTWFKNNPEADFKDIATWSDTPQTTYGMTTLDVDTSFPKGKAFSSWLTEVGAARVPGKLEVKEIARNIVATKPGKSQSWLKNGTENVQYITVNTPIGAADDKACGRAAITDIEVSGQLKGNVGYPSTCTPHEPTPQELAFEFFFFDLSACVSPDAIKPAPPVIK